MRRNAVSLSFTAPPASCSVLRQKSIVGGLEGRGWWRGEEAERHLFLQAEVYLAQQGLSATKTGRAFAHCQALQHYFLTNDINKADILPSPVGTLSLERENPGVWDKDVCVVHLLLYNSKHFL